MKRHSIITRLAKYMKSSGTNAYKLWDLTGIYPANTYHWLAGHRNPGEENIATLEKFLKRRHA